MNVFKTKVGLQEHIPITEENFQKATEKKGPYVAKSPNGGESYYAVCPECDNPIQIVALYRKESAVKPYGRYHKGSIEHLADYDEEAYLNCPYSNPDWSDPDRRRAPGSKTGMALIRTMKEQFDRIVYIWNETIPIRMSRSLAEKELRQWKANEDWRNYNASYGNLAYNLLFSHRAISIVKRMVRKDSELHDVLSRMENIELVSKNSNYSQIMPKAGVFVDLTACIGEHKPKTDDPNRDETFIFSVSSESKRIYEEEIVVQQDFLENLIKAGNEDKRDKELLEIADRILG